MLPGEKARFLNVLDNQLADDLQPLYSIDILVGKSPQKGVKCGAVSVFRLNMVETASSRYDFTKMDKRVAEEIQRAESEINKQTEVMHMDPIYFKETEGRWIGWAIQKAIEIYDSLGGNARITLKCPKLKIEQRRSRRQVAALRSNADELFPVARDIDRLLDGNFSYDPWTKKIRRGRINAQMGKR